MSARIGLPILAVWLQVQPKPIVPRFDFAETAAVYKRVAN